MNRGMAQMNSVYVILNMLMNTVTLEGVREEKLSNLDSLVWSWYKGDYFIKAFQCVTCWLLFLKFLFCEFCLFLC